MNWQSYKIEKSVSINEFFTLYTPHFEENYNFLGEMHDFWECLYVIEGTICVSADERIHYLAPGDIIFHKPMELHKFYITNKHGADLLIFSFNMQGKLCNQMANKVFRLDENQHSIISKILNFTGKYKHRIVDDTLINILELAAEAQASIQEMQLYTEELIIALSQSENALKTPKTAESVLFKSAVRYMREEISKSLSVDSLAQHLNISVSSLKRLFAKYAGMSVHKYFLSLKMKTATSLLQSGMTVSEVSDELGFSSQGYFSASYKRETGKNPSRI
jgi:AraC-like DNA-binding protein